MAYVWPFQNHAVSLDVTRNSQHIVEKALLRFIRLHTVQSSSGSQFTVDMPGAIDKQLIFLKAIA